MSPARMTTDGLPEKLRKREIDVLAVKLSRLDRRGWRRVAPSVRAFYRRLARTALAHILGTHRP